MCSIVEISILVFEFSIWRESSDSYFLFLKFVEIVRNELCFRVLINFNLNFMILVSLFSFLNDQSIEIYENLY